ncbi:hypothetical protein Tco_0190051 [Tanacetum coccineum]
MSGFDTDDDIILDDEGRVTNFFQENECEIFTLSEDSVRIFPDGVKSPDLIWEAFGGCTRDLDSIWEKIGQDCSFTRSGFKESHTVSGDGVAIPSDAVKTYKIRRQENGDGVRTSISHIISGESGITLLPPPVSTAQGNCSNGQRQCLSLHRNLLNPLPVLVSCNVLPTLVINFPHPYPNILFLGYEEVTRVVVEEESLLTVFSKADFPDEVDGIGYPLLTFGYLVAA